MKTTHHVLLAILCSSLFIGCSASCEGQSQATSDAAPPMVEMLMNVPGLAEPTEMAVVETASGQAEVGVPDVTPEKTARKISYNTCISLYVESFDGVAAKVIQLTESCGGFVAGASLSGASGHQRSGSWTIRLPVEQYRAFLDSAGSLGEINSTTEQTREVTAEFYDIEARVRNKQTEEKRLISKQSLICFRT
jgi:hypothetical protein